MKTALFILVAATAFGLTPITTQADSVALIQYDGDRYFGNKQLNITHLSSMTRQAAAQGAKIVVLPEGAITGYETDSQVWANKDKDKVDSSRHYRDVREVAERVPDGPTTQHFLRLARELDIVLFVNLIEERDGRYFNTLAILDPDGRVQTYHKRRLWHTDEFYATPGDQSLVVNTKYGSFGVLICYDAFSNKLYDDYKQQGVENIIVSMHWPTDMLVSSTNWIRSRAKRHGLNIYVADESHSDGTALYRPDGKTVRDLVVPSGPEGDQIVLVSTDNSFEG